MRTYLEPPIEARPEADDSALQARLAEVVGSEGTAAEMQRAAAHMHVLEWFRVAIGRHLAEVALSIQQRLPAFDHFEASRGEATGEIIRRFGNVRQFVFEMGGEFISLAPDGRAHASYSIAAVTTDEDGPAHLGATYRVYEG